MILWFSLPYLYYIFRNSNYFETFLFAHYNVLRNITSENVTMKKPYFAAIMFGIFTSILFFNLIGMIPYATTLTSYLVISLYMSFTIFVALNIVGFIYNKSAI